MNRVYNGCPDSRLRARLYSEDVLLKRLQQLRPSARCTYFPAQERYVVYIGNEPASGEHESKIGALNEAIRRLTVPA